jgi:hypothetical protein
MLNNMILMRLASVASVYGNDKKGIGKENFLEIEDTWGTVLYIVDFGYNGKGELRSAMIVTAHGGLLEVEKSDHDGTSSHPDPDLGDLLLHYYVDLEIPSEIEPMCTLCDGSHWGVCAEGYAKTR